MKLFHQNQGAKQMRISRNLDFPVHLHNAVELVFLKKGTVTILQSNGRQQLAPGDLFLSFPMEPHGYEESRNVEAYVWILPVNSYLSPYQSILEHKLPQDPILHQTHWEHTGVGQLMELAMTEPKDTAPEVMQGYVQLVVGKLLGLIPLIPRQNTGADAMQQLLLFLNTHYREPLKRKQIAHAVGYNESYISHLFSEVFQITLTDYLTALRLEDASRLLRETEMPVTEIALSVGFGSIRSFHRAFSRKYGVSPRQYRKG